MKSIVLALLAAVLCGCVSVVDQRKLEPVTAGERVNVAAPVKIIENRGLVKLEWQLLPGSYVERYSSTVGRVFLSEGNLVQFTSSLGEKTMHTGGFIVLKDKPGAAKLYVVRGPTGQPIGYDAVVALLGAGWEGDLTLVTDFRLSEIKRR